MKKVLVPFMMGLALLYSARPVSVSAATPTAITGPAISAYAHVIRKINPHLPLWQSNDLARHVLVNARRFKVDANLLVALVSVESAWRTHARSRVGAFGLGQLMPGTAARLGVDSHNPAQNLSGAAHYLGGLMFKFKNHPNRVALAAAAYNAGPRAVTSFGGIPPYAETQHYVVKVLRAWKHIRNTVHVPAQALALRIAPMYSRGIQILEGAPSATVNG
ncbi:MAG: lytic transglycosylase domain-containing protein [Candidatus Eremiobacteraeota bacterium]|nr:lytic transglycosylase domain-containing protein [Candidatus Eremiobacteraeota bacterium]